MSIENVNNGANQGIPVDSSKRTDADRQEIKRLAQQFEAMLMTQMLREMRRSMLDDEDAKENGFGAEANRRHRPDRELVEGLRTSDHGYSGGRRGRKVIRGRRGKRGRRRRSDCL